MNKKFNIVGNLVVVRKTIALSAGIMIMLFSCTEEVKACDTFVVTDSQVEMSKDITPTISANLEIELAPNVELKATSQDSVNMESGLDNVLENFVSSILSDTKPLDADISKFVDDNFWDLI